MTTNLSMHDLKWSDSERRIARRVFDDALQRELQETMALCHSKAAAARSVDEMWALADWLQSRRRDIDRRFDFRYGELLPLFARLLREGRLTREALSGLRADKQDFLDRLLSL